MLRPRCIRGAPPGRPKPGGRRVAMGSCDRRRRPDWVVANGRQPQGILDCLVDLLLAERIHQPQHLDILLLAPRTHGGLQETAQGIEPLGSSHPAKGAAWSRAPTLRSNNRR